MKKSAKPSRKFGRRKVKQKFRVWQESWDRQPIRMPEEAIASMDELSPGFREWYRENYDNEGRYVREKL